ncbi:T9SS-dependent choice-of-anchor J family protein [Chryseobacterium culicis]|uniref:T9SS-dependent choice-of-anchor J family protein n=1 Tax=Chryseobacterium culicis TaxID=680127 RepID=UPI0028970D91|nr:choice-of-anchor J domain-containing protein [Chryseobacterium culicis]
MKRTLLLGISLLLADHGMAQTTIFEETFENSPMFQIPLNWENINRSSTFPTWNVTDLAVFTNAMGFSGKVATMSVMNAASDQILVSPAISLQNGSTYALKFLVGTFTSNNVFSPQGHYAVYIIPAGSNFTGNETPVLEEDIVNGDIAKLKNVDITGYAGQSIRIYFRQFSSITGMEQLLIDTVQITEQNLLGTSEESMTREDVMMYPNPSFDYLNIQSKSKIMHVKMFDMTGKEMNITRNSDSIAIDHLQPGTYIVSIVTDNKIYNKKLIKK